MTYTRSLVTGGKIFFSPSMSYNNPPDKTAAVWGSLSLYNTATNMQSARTTAAYCANNAAMRPNDVCIVTDRSSSLTGYCTGHWKILKAWK